MAVIVENKIEEAWIAILEAETYVAAQSIPVRKFRDNSTAKNPPLIVVNVEPALNELGNISGELWTCAVNLISVTFTADDKDQANLDNLYQACLDVAKNTTMAALTAETSDLVFFASVLEQGEEEYGSDYQVRAVKLTNHIQTT